MTLQRARELLQIQLGLGSGYNRNSARLILAEVQKEHGQAAVDQLIRDARATLDQEKAKEMYQEASRMWARSDQCRSHPGLLMDLFRLRRFLPALE